MPESNLEPTTDFSTRLQSESQPDLVEIPTIQLLEERLNVKIHQRKIGEVVVRKVVETEIVEIPIRREKLVIEQVEPDQQQLAAIDLGSNLNREELAAFIDDRSLDAPAKASAARTTVTGHEFLSIELAHQLLSAILNQPAYQNSKVKLVFEDARLQTAYERWLERYIIR